MRQKLQRTVLCVIFTISQARMAFAETRQIVFSPEQQLASAIEKISELDKSGKLNFYNKSHERLDLTSLLASPEKNSEVSVVTGEISKIYPGFRMKIMSKIQGRSLGLTILDLKDQKVLGRVAIALETSGKPDSGATRKIQLDNALQYLATQTEASLRYQGKIATVRTPKKLNLFLTAFKVLMPKANASTNSQSSAVEVFREVFISVLGPIVGILVVGYAIVVTGRFLIESNSTNYMAKYGPKHIFANSRNLAIVKGLLGLIFIASLFAGTFALVAALDEK